MNARTFFFFFFLAFAVVFASLCYPMGSVGACSERAPSLKVDRINPRLHSPLWQFLSVRASQFWMSAGSREKVVVPLCFSVYG
jgi:hypothetical protein